MTGDYTVNLRFDDRALLFGVTAVAVLDMALFAGSVRTGDIPCCR